MTLWTGPVLPLAALVWPLLLAALTALPGLRAHGVRLLPLAPLPALWLAVAGSEAVTTVPDLLLGVTLGLTEGGRLLLGMAAALWCLAGLAAQPMAGKPHVAIFAGFWTLTLTGNLGVFLARDIVTFYVAFAAVSLAAWFLIVHDRTPKAMQAGTVYIVIALAGEVALLVGLILGADAAGSMDIVDVREALGPLPLALLVIGFGIKAGLVPLHVWLPLAHPAAPVPASAVLSGAIVKAGLFGLILFLPEGTFGMVLIGLGLAGAFGAALWGLTQANAKTVLAYSTISQMGLMIGLIGAGGAAREAVPYVALHHGFAKGALFLSVGVMLAARARWQRLACLAVAGIVSASVAGFPLTGGALAKTVAKDGLSEIAVTVLSLSSVTTSLILIWFLVTLWRLDGSGEASRWTPQLLVPALAGGLAFAGPWGLWPVWSGKEAAYLFAPATVRDALWPVAIALHASGVPAVEPAITPLRARSCCFLSACVFRPTWRPRPVVWRPHGKALFGTVLHATAKWRPA
ncbi:MAG: complex I subunit 5 family protein [Roseovarius sp.]|nr:complex I subunit 5 family protein [Roseovarius sp.]